MNVKATAVLSVLLWAAAGWAGNVEPGSEQLIIFLQPGQSPVDLAFQERFLPKIRALGESMGVDVYPLDVGKGAPSEVGVTPLIVYQNHLGRSIYQGRTTALNRIRHFIRTSRFVPQGAAPNRREQIPVWKIGKAQVWIPLKVTDLTGHLPASYSHAAFVSEATEGIVAGLDRFRMRDVVELGRADRGFYMDFYPWLSEDGTLHISFALYSQFDCKEPVFRSGDDPVAGPWTDRKNLFKKAASILQEKVVASIRDAEIGDGFDPVVDTLPEVDWKKLGFALPGAPKKAALQQPVDLTLPRHWILSKSGPDDPPMIQFRFQPPLDQYRGEIITAAGGLALPENQQLEGADGFVEIDTRTAVTMGDPVLDEVIRGSLMLYAQKYPTARYTLKSFRGDDQPLVYGELKPATLEGVFTLKGKRIPLPCVGEVEPVIGRSGIPQLLVRGSFQIDLREFDIEGADGPAPARYTLQFDINLIFGPRTADR